MATTTMAGGDTGLPRADRIKLHPLDLTMPPVNARLHLLCYTSSYTSTQLEQAFAQALSGPVMMAYSPAFGSYVDAEAAITLPTMPLPLHPDTLHVQTISDTAASLDADALAALPLQSGPNQPLFAVKISLLTDGHVYVAMSLNHRVGDLAAFVKLASCLSDSVDAYLHGRDPPAAAAAQEDVTKWRRSPLDFFDCDCAPFAEGYKLVPMTAGRPPGVPPVAEQIKLHFSKPALSRLKEVASPPDGSARPWISTGDALSALLWRALTRAKSSGGGGGKAIEPGSMVRLCIAVDGRRAANVGDMDAHCFGNFNTAAVVSLRHDRLVGQDAPLSDIAQRIRTLLKSATTIESIVGQVKAAEAAFASSPEPNLLVPDADAMTGLDCALTNWSKFELQDLNFGLGDRLPIADAGGVAFPRGTVHVMAADKGGMTVQMALGPEEAVELRGDQEVLKFAALI